jgi:hypothetical protein
MCTRVIAGLSSTFILLLCLSSPIAAQGPKLPAPPNSGDTDRLEEAHDELARRLFERRQREQTEGIQPRSTGSALSLPEAPASSIWDPTWTPLDPSPLGQQALTPPEPGRQAVLPEPRIELPPPVAAPTIPLADHERVAEHPSASSAAAAKSRVQTRVIRGTKGLREVQSRAAKKIHGSRRNRAHGVARSAPARSFADVFRIVGRGMGNGMSCMARGTCKSSRQMVEGAMGAVSAGIVGAGVAGGPGLVTGSIVGVVATAPRFRAGGTRSPPRRRH